MVTSSAVVGSSAISSRGTANEGHGDHHPLTHAARQFVRILGEAPLGLGRCRPASSIADRGAAGLAAAGTAMELEHLGDLAADRHRRIEARHRFLEDHRHAVAAQRPHAVLREADEIAALEADAAALDPRRRHRQEAHDGLRGDALAAARFADQAQDLAAAEREGHIVDERRCGRPRCSCDTVRPSTARRGAPLPSAITRKRRVENRRRPPSSACRRPR